MSEQAAQQAIAVLDEMTRRESIPRTACPKCSFEFTADEMPQHEKRCAEAAANARPAVSAPQAIQNEPPFQCAECDETMEVVMSGPLPGCPQGISTLRCPTDSAHMAQSQPESEPAVSGAGWVERFIERHDAQTAGTPEWILRSCDAPVDNCPTTFCVLPKGHAGDCEHREPAVSGDAAEARHRCVEFGIHPKAGCPHDDLTPDEGAELDRLGQRVEADALVARLRAYLMLRPGDSLVCLHRDTLREAADLIEVLQKRVAELEKRRIVCPACGAAFDRCSKWAKEAQRKGTETE